MAMSSTGVVPLEEVDEVEVESIPLVDELLVELVELSPVVCGTVVGVGVPNPDVSAELALQAHASARTGRKGRGPGRIDRKDNASSLWHLLPATFRASPVGREQHRSLRIGCSLPEFLKGDEPPPRVGEVLGRQPPAVHLPVDAVVQALERGLVQP